MCIFHLWNISNYSELITFNVSELIRINLCVFFQRHFLDGGPAGRPGTIDVMEVMSGGMGRGGAHGIRPRQGITSPPSPNQYHASHGDTLAGTFHKKV